MSREWTVLRTRWHVGLRAGLSVGVPLVAGVLSGQSGWGAVASLGGLAGVYGADTPGPHRIRLVATVGAVLTVVVPLSSLCASRAWLSVLFTGVVAGIGALVCRALRVPPPREYLIVLATLVATGTPAGPAEALGHCAMVAAGALIALAVTVVPVSGRAGAPHTKAVDRAWAAVREVLRTAGTPDAASAREHAVSEVAWAREVVRQAGLPGTDERPRSLAAAEVVLPSALSVSIEAGEPLDPATWTEALAQLRPEATEIAGLRQALEAAERVRRDDDEAPDLPRVSLRRRLREALNRDGVVLPAAVRVGVAVAAGVALGHLLGLGHAYWVGLTVAAVLQASNVSVLVRRSANRIGGTIAGVALAAAVFAPQPTALVVAVVALVAQFAAELLMPTRYGVAVMFVTLVPLSIYDLAAPGAEIGSAVGARLLDTAIGVVLAVVLRLLLWPRATAARLPQVQAKALRATAEVFRSRWLHGELAPARRRLQERVLDLHNVADDALADHVRRGATSGRDQITVAIDQLAMLALSVPFERPHPPRDSAETLVAQLEKLADALHSGPLPAPMAPVPGYPRTTAAAELLRSATGRIRR